MFPLKSFDNFYPEDGCSEGLDAFIIFLKERQTQVHQNRERQNTKAHEAPGYNSVIISYWVTVL